jgi:hypothetical protein
LVVMPASLPSARDSSSLTLPGLGITFTGLRALLPGSGRNLSDLSRFDGA